MNATAPGTQCLPGSKMTMRVYTVDRSGAVKEDRGTVTVQYGQDLPPMMSVSPPCECPRCRARLVVR